MEVYLSFQHDLTDHMQNWLMISNPASHRSAGAISLLKLMIT